MERCQAVLKRRVYACASRVSRAVLSFPSFARLKLRTTSSKRCDTCTNLHTGSTGVCLTRPRGQIYARRCLDACPRVQRARAPPLSNRSTLPLDRSFSNDLVGIERANEFRARVDWWTIPANKSNFSINIK